MAKQLLASLLPPAQLRESNNLVVHPVWIEGEATFVAPPYQAMSDGDEAALTLQGYIDFREPFPLEPVTKVTKVTAEDIGKPLTWRIEKSFFDTLVGGYVEISYSIKYAEPTKSTQSVMQTVQILWDTDPVPEKSLPPPTIKGFAGEELDPNGFLGGIVFKLKHYDGIQVGDDVMLYGNQQANDVTPYSPEKNSVIKTVRVDQSTIDSEILEIHLEHAWLLANIGKDVSFLYQYGREGHAGTSEPLKLALREPLDLPFPLVDKVTDDGVAKGFLMANGLTGGIFIELPKTAGIGEKDSVQMHFVGYGSTGSHIANPTANKERFQIPPAVVPPNMGKRVTVFYKVTPPGKNSEVFDLEIKDITREWPVLQIKSPPSPSNQISVRAATQGVVFRLGSWLFMSPGQWVKIQVAGKLESGGEEVFDLRVGSAEVVTTSEYLDGELLATLPLTFLLKLKRDESLNVSISASFDQGSSYKQFPWIGPKVVD